MLKLKKQPYNSVWISADSQKELYDLEEKYDNEDTEMLIQLIKIRNHLWTKLFLKQVIDYILPSGYKN
jgi:hypothetical protein